MRIICEIMMTVIKITTPNGLVSFSSVRTICFKVNHC